MCIVLYRWSIELEGIFVLPVAPRWVRHSYLAKKATNDPLYLWVINVLDDETVGHFVIAGRRQYVEQVAGTGEHVGWHLSRVFPHPSEG